MGASTFGADETRGPKPGKIAGASSASPLAPPSPAERGPSGPQTAAGVIRGGLYVNGDLRGTRDELRQT